MVHTTSAVAFAVLALTATTMALPVMDQTQEIVARDVEPAVELDAREVDFGQEIDAREFDEFDLDAREFDFEEVDAREFEVEDFEARDYLELDLDAREFDEDLFERNSAPSTPTTPTSTTTAAPSKYTIVEKDTNTQIVVEVQAPKCRNPSIFARLKLRTRHSRQKKRLEKERKSRLKKARKAAKKAARKAAREAKKAKKAAKKAAKKNAKANPTPTPSPTPTGAATASPSVPATPAPTALVLKKGETIKRVKKETTGSSTIIHYHLFPSPTPCAKGSEKKAKREFLDELD